MKYENQVKLARIANNDTWNGGARAMVLATRIMAIFPYSEAMQIVSNVYTHPQGSVEAGLKGIVTRPI